MQTIHSEFPAGTVTPFASLRGLGLDEDELAALRRQGYLQRDRRAAGSRGYWRLRFRVSDRTRTAYVGDDARVADNVQRELEALQAGHRQRRALARAVREGRQALRRAKARLKPILAELGMHFHGRTARRTRRRSD